MPVSLYPPAPESVSETITSPTPEDIEEMREMMKERDEKMEKMAKVPIQEHVFAECSRERILGLLAAMLPPAKPVRWLYHKIAAEARKSILL